ncbi:hypothetical protein NDU88_010783 [Pleurodeles waltl]|uniref:Uncharacterized protein n=1 Tax=Pleurodeles waltl TaxID=8319 RepID=A0AAV7S3K4_PLEWA|nr:hypothetical protein NDU88_010783 [Pleurodeles waltl]
MEPVTGWTEPARTILLHVLSPPAVTRNPTGAPPIREESPGHGRKAEEQEGWCRAFEEEKCREERRVRSEAEERTRTSWRGLGSRLSQSGTGGPERPGSRSSQSGT